MTDDREDAKGRASDSQQIDARERAGHERDVTRAIKIAEDLRDNPETRDGAKYSELVALLDAIDARTGRRDPTKRDGKAALSAQSSKTSTALETARKLNGLSFGSPDWMRLIQDIITILNDLHVIPTNQPQAPPAT
jgi:hypothetical protein